MAKMRYNTTHSASGGVIAPRIEYLGNDDPLRENARGAFCGCLEYEKNIFESSLKIKIIQMMKMNAERKKSIRRSPICSLRVVSRPPERSEKRLKAKCAATVASRESVTSIMPPRMSPQIR